MGDFWAKLEQLLDARSCNGSVHEAFLTATNSISCWEELVALIEISCPEGREEERAVLQAMSRLKRGPSERERGIIEPKAPWMVQKFLA